MAEILGPKTLQDTLLALWDELERDAKGMNVNIEWTTLPTPMDRRDFEEKYFPSKVDADGRREYPQMPRGALLRLEGGGIFLVGDVNRMGGVCDDCTMDESIVAFSLSLVLLIPKD